MSEIDRRSCSKVDAVILNPFCKGGRGLSRWKDLLQTQVAQARGLTQAAVFDGGVDLVELRQWVLQKRGEGALRFVAVGGDGTVNLAVNALRGTGAVLGAIGLGSSNDFHKPRKFEDWPEIPTRLNFEHAFDHDLGQVEISSEDSSVTPSSEVDFSSAKVIFFAVNASVGLTAEANALFNSSVPILKTLKKTNTDLAITYASIREWLRYRAIEMNLKFEESPSITTRVTNLGIVKNPHFAGSFRYDIPNAPNSGVFGVHLCEDMTRLETLRTLLYLGKGRFSGLPKTRSYQCTEVRLNAEHPFTIETDGEVRQAKRARFKVIKNGMTLCP